ncbi:MAG: hypothetical protein ACN6P1_07530 [Pseudomonas sp.]|uniref:hypothetical protein n=1 Tax=Pseudomonas sp. TaxID=306 RepID=UPI003D10AE90
MNIKYLLSRLLSRKGERFLDFKVGGCVVRNVVPLGNYLTPGVTKVGRLSFAGWMNDKKVKIYSCHSRAQVDLRLALDKLSFSNFSLPSVLAVEGDIVVEEWIEGEVIRSSGAFESALACNIINEFHDSTCYLGREFLARSPFCYFEDYLVARLGRWRGVAQIAEMLSTWQAQLASLESVIAPKLFHPDLSYRNMIRSARDGRFVVVDNELLGVGRGWVLDWHNAGIPNCSLQEAAGSVDIKDFVSLSWDLRRLGSMLDACDYRGVRGLLGG